MYKYSLITMFFIFLGIELTACLVAQNDSIDLLGPTELCQSSPIGSYTVPYTVAPENNLSLIISLRGGQLFNLEYSSVSVPTTPTGCNAELIEELINPNVGGCIQSYEFLIPRGCIGSIHFDVFYSPFCISQIGGSNPIFDIGYFNENFSTTESFAEFITVDASCFKDDDGNLNLLKSKSDSNSTNELNQDFMIDFFPNPAMTNSDVTIDFSNKNISSKEINILDINGKLIKQYKGIYDQLNINTIDLKEGIYLIQAISEDGQVKTKKLILSK